MPHGQRMLSVNSLLILPLHPAPAAPTCTIACHTSTLPPSYPLACWPQKLVVSLDRASRPEVKEFQRRCEEAAVDVLLKGAPPPVSQARCRANHAKPCVS